MEINHDATWNYDILAPSKFDKKRLVFGRIDGKFQFLGVFERHPVKENICVSYKHKRIARGIDLTTYELIDKD